MMFRKHADSASDFKKRLHQIIDWFHSVNARCTLIVGVTTILLFLIFSAVSTPQRYSVSVGLISHETITATKDVVDEVTTESRRKAAADAVEPIYRFQEGASEGVMAHLDVVFKELSLVQQYGLTLRNDESRTEPEGQYSEEEIAYAKSLVTSMTLSSYQAMTLMNTDTPDFVDMVDSVVLAVENALNTTIREGQVNESIDSILKIVGYTVKVPLFQNILPVVLRTCVQPNMLIETEATEEARQRARDTVEPVVYLQGQNIVRAGERVTATQYELLSALGLLTNDQYDLSIYGGAALMVLLSMAVLLVLLMLLEKNILKDVRRLSVVMVVMVISMGLAVVAFRYINVHLTPVAICAILLTSLLGARVAVSASISMALLISGLTAASSNAFSSDLVHLLLTSVASSMFAVYYLKGKSQRVFTVVCGTLVAVCNFIMILALGLMTSSDTLGLIQHAVWSMAGGFLGGLISLGFQPLFETTFNLATPSKLLELANPNQPILRRLLLEAPGTYHHSIIVANLAETAAERIGANPLLARTGAYFHDIGKLKRPVYFKENQIGENPHDRTDPYVSAAILTAHTRDGLALAQKHRLPPEIQHVIIEHHGDTPVMYFYHKATQAAEGKTVDIADFRYDGVRPSTQESAIIMLADTVEAAVRSMADPTPQAIEKFIEKLVRGKMDDGQLSNAPLTLRDIDGICAAFCQVLNGVFHERIEYPTVELPARNHGEAAKDTVEAKPAEIAEQASREDTSKASTEEQPK